MSTNKTQNYALHAWEPTDDFQLSEVNQNFAALDAALAARYPVVIGTYVGDGAQDRLIDLGAAVAAVLVENEQSNRPDYDHYMVFGGLAITDVPLKNNALVVDGTGFRVSRQSSSDGKVDLRTNNINVVYRYIAWLEP